MAGSLTNALPSPQTCSLLVAGVLIVLIGPWTATVGSTGTVGDVVLYPEGGAKSHRPDADARKLPVEETDDVLRPLTLQQAS